MVNVIKRTIQEKIEDKLFKGKVIILYGPRQVGKTTIVKEIQNKNISNSIYFNCDEPDIREKFENKTSTFLKELIGNKKIVIIDEAQRVKDIGITLKLIIDNFKDIQVIATGSSSFDLANKTAESLTGRKYEFYLYPLSIEELNPEKNKLEIDRTLENRIIYGSYPEVIINSSEAEENIKLIAKSYLYKDILQYQNIKNPDILEKLLQSLALQVGNEVSYNEISNFLDIDKKTVASYIEILKKAFVIFELKPFSRNLRNELRKLRKIYFFDTGARNALINNFNSLDRRNDAGQLWENFIISERIKINNNHGNDYNIYFWRTHNKKEIDYIEEKNGKLYGYEIKLGSGKSSGAKLFLDTYVNSEFKIIKKDNYNEFIF
ncbi:MAG: ATP-binding protein [Candidatus Pacebacteria bacterium]|nr:ATP-binding protein [Candidatus Paceibacterota bacterium]MDD3283944.1 ATP-binding protein [Candidatus Paceibacterota bacterium]MDD3969918.1 ATP-binding protein [Candidatus Paceibacterota bacterium]MDD4737825.1 ATP-binding protein [Candidatus Paceibacterota bacterium]